MSVHTSGEIEDVQWKIIASTGTGKEIAGLEEEDEEYDTKSRMNGCSCRELQERMKFVGIFIGRYGPVSDFWRHSYVAILAEFRGVLYADHVRFTRAVSLHIIAS